MKRSDLEVGVDYAYSYDNEWESDPHTVHRVRVVTLDPWTKTLASAPLTLESGEVVQVHGGRPKGQLDPASPVVVVRFVDEEKPRYAAVMTRKIRERWETASPRLEEIRKEREESRRKRIEQGERNAETYRRIRPILEEVASSATPLPNRPLPRGMLEVHVNDLEALINYAPKEASK
ncbi:MAG TPA: hypothetical protein VLZ78_04000 [Terrimesophilobacter sp.]|nr:hypothetical protein [Terrimesophilobacter sp.]